MLFSKNRFYRQAERGDKHLLVNGPVNLMVDSRGVSRPFGLTKPISPPSIKVLDKQGALKRDVRYSYCYSYLDSYADAESVPSDFTEFLGLGSIGLYSSFGFSASSSGEPDFSKILVTGDDLSKEDDYYKGQSIAVEVTNNDRKTEYSQWQYRKIFGYRWLSEQNAGEFTLSRPLINVDSDPDDRNYKVKISDIECEEGTVGGASSGNNKLVLGPTATTDVGSYRLKVIRITAGKGKGQSRLIADACLNKDGLVEITVSKPWKTKPKYVDPTSPNAIKHQEGWQNRENLKEKYFNKWFSSEYMISDPMRHSGLCVDGEITSYDKKTGLYVIDGLGNGSAILSGQVVRFVSDNSDDKELSSIVISLENSDTADSWVKSQGLVDKTLRITSGPGSGSSFVIVSCKESGENSISLGLSTTSTKSSIYVNGTPNASSTYVILSADPVSTSDLSITSYSKTVVPSISNYSDGLFVPGSYNESSDLYSPYIPSGSDLASDAENAALAAPADSALYASLASVVPLDELGNPNFQSLIGQYFTFYDVKRYHLKSNGSVVCDNPNDFAAYTGEIYHVHFSSVANTLVVGFRCAANQFPGQPKKYKKVVGSNGLVTKKKSGSVVSWTYGWNCTLYLSVQSVPFGGRTDPSFDIFVSSFEHLGLDPDTYIPGSYSLNFTVCPDDTYSLSDADKKKYSYKITRPIIGLAAIESNDSEADTLYKVTLSGNLPILHAKDGVTTYLLSPVVGSNPSVLGNSLMEGYYTGWKALVFNPDNDSKPKKKYLDARVAGYFDATGSILLDTKLAGVGPGWQVVLYSEYSRCLGTAVAPYDSDEFYEKKTAPLRVYTDFVPLESFASSEAEDPETGTVPYEGWTVRALSSSKTKKNGTIKYSTVSDKKSEKSKRTIVKYFPNSHRAYVHYKEEDSTFPSDSAYFSPGLDGSEHLWLYDESSGIDFLFNEDIDSNNYKDSKSDDYGCRIKVSDIKPSPLPGVDKIRLYRATDFTNDYHLIATLDNKYQDFEDNVAEVDSSLPLDLAYAPLPPCGVCCFYKGRFVAGGVPDGTQVSPTDASACPSISPIPSSYFALFPYDYEHPIYEGYTYSDGASLNSSVNKLVPALSIPFGPDIDIRFPSCEGLKAEKLRVFFLISQPSSDGLLVYARQPVFSGLTQQISTLLNEVDTSADFVYFPRSASSDSDAYDGCRVTIHTQNADNPYYSAEIAPGSYTGVTRCLGSVLINQFYELPSPPPRRYPSFAFSIDRLLWSLERITENGSAVYRYSDVFGNKFDVSPTEVPGPNGTSYLSFSFTADQGTLYGGLEYHLGGSLGSLGTSASADLLAFSFTAENNDVIETYLPSLGKFSDADDSSLAMTIPGVGNNQLFASVYTSNDAKLTRSSVASGSALYWIAVLDKFVSANVSSKPISVSPRNNAYSVYVCSTALACGEKYLFENSYSFADDLGDRITGLASHPRFIIVFKERGIYALEPFEQTIQALHHDIGCIAPDSIAVGRSGIYWFSADRRVLRSSFEKNSTIYYASKELEPWLDNSVDIDGESFDKSRSSEVKATYDADSDEYMIAFPTKSGKWLLFAFKDDAQTWFRIYDHSGTDEPCSENAFNCLFKNRGRASFASDHGVYSYIADRPGFYPWKYASSYLTESNSGMRKLVKRIQIINLIDNSIPSDPVPSAYFEFFRNLSDQPEESYQREGRYTRRFFDTNKYVQYVHVGVRALMWNFIMYSSDQDHVSNANFVRIHDLTLHYRNKHDDEPLWSNTPFSDPPNGTS